MSKIFHVLQWVTGHLGLAQVFLVGLGYSGFSCGIAHSEKNLISIFQVFSSSVDGAFILVGGRGGRGLGAQLSFYVVWSVSWYFLIS